MNWHIGIFEDHLKKANVVRTEMNKEKEAEVE